MKLIIQIPCYNEEATLPVTLRDLPKKIPGIDEIQILVINDGSTDDTEEVIKLFNDKKIIYRKQKNQGVAQTLNNGF